MVGRILEASKYFDHPDYLDITDGLVFSQTAYPKLYNVIKDEDWANMTLEQEINNYIPGLTRNFGESVAIYGDTLVGGVPRRLTGSVDVYTRSGSTWTFEQEIVNPAPISNDHFGASVSIFEDTIAVGTPDKDLGAVVDTGSVSIFTRSGTTWTLEQTIDNPSPIADDSFGFDVSLYMNTIAIGVPLKDTGATDAGEVHVYVRSGTTWTLQQIIVNPSPIASDNFGKSISLYQDTLVIGCPYDDTGATDAGVVYVYARNGTTWTLEQTIDNPSPAIGGGIGENFGFAVSVYNNTLGISARGNDVSGFDSGTVYIYENSNGIWTLEQTINNPSPEAYDFFGEAISIGNNVIVIGTKKINSSSGAIYVYSRTGTTWNFQHEIFPPTPVSFDEFGMDVGIFGDSIVTGAPGDDTGLDGAGSVYVYRIPLTNDNIIKPKQTNNPDTKFFIKAK